MRVPADTNIYISALQFGGVPKRFLDLARDSKVALMISPAILEELAEVLREKFKRTESDILDAMSRISRMTQNVNPSNHVEAVQSDPDDNAILECAQAADSDFIVSGDKHLLNLKCFGRIRIVTVSAFLRILEQQ